MTEKQLNHGLNGTFLSPRTAFVSSSLVKLMQHLFRYMCLCGILLYHGNIALSQDNSAYPAFNKELIINIEGDSVAGYAFIAEDNEPKETIILISGYPGNDNNFDIAMALRRHGKNVIHFNHRGAWGSQGVYSYTHCLEDVVQMVNYLSQPAIADDLRIDTAQFCLIGRSYGGGIALIQGSQIPAVKKIIAISSVNYGDLMKKYKTVDELTGFKKYMKKQIMMNHDIDAFLQELLDHKDAFNVVNHNTALAEKKVIIIDDSNKNKGWVEQLDQAESVVLQSDHNFIDKREELIELIIKWLQ